MQEFKEVLDCLHSFPHVRLILTTRMAAPVDHGVKGGAVLKLRRLDAAAGMQLLESHFDMSEHIWGSRGQEAALKLVEAVQGNPLVLSVAAGLVEAGHLTWQVSS